MGCTHPVEMELIVRDHDHARGVRCPVCGGVAFEGDTFWTSIKEGTKAFLGGSPRAGWHHATREEFDERSTP